MQRTQIYLDPDQIRWLKKMASSRRSTLSEIIREAIGQWIGKKTKPQKDPLGNIVGLLSLPNDRSGAAHHNDIYD